MNFWGGEWRRDKLHLNTMALTLPTNCSNECINEKVIFSILKPCFSCKYVKTIHLCTENSLLNLFQIFWKSQGIGLFLHNYIHTLAGRIYILIFHFYFTNTHEVKFKLFYLSCSWEIWLVIVATSAERIPFFYFIRIVSLFAVISLQSKYVMRLFNNDAAVYLHAKLLGIRFYTIGIVLVYLKHREENCILDINLVFG